MKTPDSPSGKKRRTNAAANSQMPTQASPSLPDLVPPPPMIGYGETIVASNPFDDMPPHPPSSLHPPPSAHNPPPPPQQPPQPPMHNKPVPMSSGKVSIPNSLF
ncbi:PYGO2 [Cordylochernes scorpioides]|uniref:PYGO2 n=1 Tax=Cordylochernes scorpioides TaxID=51811 RepID=A0ABY6KIH0_9ARAC|nr:PYGO2 [Cordylochernes scorpioides]